MVVPDSDLTMDLYLPTRTSGLGFFLTLLRRVIRIVVSCISVSVSVSILSSSSEVSILWILVRVSDVHRLRAMVALCPDDTTLVFVDRFRDIGWWRR